VPSSGSFNEVSIVRMGVSHEARIAVRSELDAFTGARALDLGNGLKTFVRDYHLKLRSGDRIDDAYVFGLADRIAAYARTHPNVIRVDGLRRPTTSIARKGRADVHMVAVEPTDHGTYVLSRIHHGIDRAAMTWAWDDGRINFVPHVAERLLERGDAEGDGMRRAGRALYDAAGMLALGARLWSNMDRGDRTWGSIAIPLGDGGLAMGSLIPRKASGGMKVAAARLSASGIKERDVAIPGMAILPRFVHAKPEDRHALTFTAMTYVGPGDMSQRKERVRDLLAGIRDRHPVVALAGMAWLWPESRVIQEKFAGLRGQFAKAYEELASIHDDPDVAAIFGRRFWKKPPPLPWEERPADAIPHLTTEVSRWATPAEAREAWLALMEAHRIAQEERDTHDAGSAPPPRA
jgi:hypothetical protein